MNHALFIYGTIVAETSLYQDYTRPEPCIKTALFQAKMFPCKLGCCLPDSVILSGPWTQTVSVFLHAQTRLRDNPALWIFDVIWKNDKSCKAKRLHYDNQQIAKFRENYSVFCIRLNTVKYKIQVQQCQSWKSKKIFIKNICHACLSRCSSSINEILSASFLNRFMHT